MKRRGKRITLLAGAGVLAVAVLAGIYREKLAAHYRFWRLFESIGQNEQRYHEYRHRQTGIVMVRVPGGTFTMGSAEDDETSKINERPAHLVTLDPFLIAKYEVTRLEWFWFETETGYLDSEKKVPILTISWEECQIFCMSTNLKLPTEAQWEFACRGGRSGPCADPYDLRERAWFRDNTAVISTQRPMVPRQTVGGKKPNSFGLYDMQGNVAEWCEDAHDWRFYREASARERNPVNTSASGEKVVRGGSCMDWGWECRPASRKGVAQQEASPYIGFRPAYYPLP